MTYRVAKYNDYEKSGGKGTWDKGILEVSLDSWDEFHEVTTKLLDLGDFIWRGQEYDWPLISKFDRVVTSDRKAKLKSHSDAFVRAIKGRRGNNPPELDTPEKIWSLGQHYGLATPLLDWTESPFVAAYFAFEPKIEVDSLISAYNKKVLEYKPKRYIYGLSQDIERWGPSLSKGVAPYDHFIKFVPSESDENPRILSQRGQFTETLSAEIEIEKTVGLCYAEDEKKGLNRIIFVKLYIPDTERETCLRNLNRMNINHATLFPDLIGAAEYCNVKLEITNYS
jgi:hypothetical protein